MLSPCEGIQLSRSEMDTKLEKFMPVKGQIPIRESLGLDLEMS